MVASKMDKLTGGRCQLIYTPTHPHSRDSMDLTPKTDTAEGSEDGLRQESHYLMLSICRRLALRVGLLPAAILLVLFFFPVPALIYCSYYSTTYQPIF